MTGLACRHPESGSDFEATFYGFESDGEQFVAARCGNCSRWSVRSATRRIMSSGPTPKPLGHEVWRLAWLRHNGLLVWRRGHAARFDPATAPRLRLYRPRWRGLIEWVPIPVVPADTELAQPQEEWR